MSVTPPPRADDDARTRLDDDGGPTLAAPAAELATLASRQCGRCRLFFEGDPTLHAAALPEWWLCPTCREILLGDPPAAAPARNPGPKR